MHKLSNILQCPGCKSPYLDSPNIKCNNTQCANFDANVETVNGIPILVDFDHSILEKDKVLRSLAKSVVVRSSQSWIRRIGRRFLNGSNRSTIRNIRKCIDLLKDRDNPRILIVGGGTIGVGIDLIIRSYPNTVAFDVYYSNEIDFIADGHSIPLINECVDLIIIQAVLEHVLFPADVVAESFRVLKDGGFVYAETPFLQHVHEGAYDYTRFTVLGHRILFNKFVKIDTGFVGGLGQSLLWSIEYYFGALFRSRIVGKMFKLAFIWVRVLEKTLPHAWNIDGACGTYFLGRKQNSFAGVKIKEVVREYQGAQK